MKRIKVLGSVLKRTRADKIIIGFIVFIFAIAAVIQLVEPDINRYGDALWYCYAVISTAGFGDVVAERISPPDSGHRTCTVSGSGKIHEINELLENFHRPDFRRVLSV